LAYRILRRFDEYDKPLLQAIGNEALQNEYRGTLKAFYGALKSCNREVEEGFVKYLVPYYSPSKAHHL